MRLLHGQQADLGAAQVRQSVVKACLNRTEDLELTWQWITETMENTGPPPSVESSNGWSSETQSSFHLVPGWNAMEPSWLGGFMSSFETQFSLTATEGSVVTQMKNAPNKSFTQWQKGTSLKRQAASTLRGINTHRSSTRCTVVALSPVQSQKRLLAGGRAACEGCAERRNANNEEGLIYVNIQGV